MKRSAGTMSVMTCKDRHIGPCLMGTLTSRIPAVMSEKKLISSLATSMCQGPSVLSPACRLSTTTKLCSLKISLYLTVAHCQNTLITLLMSTSACSNACYFFPRSSASIPWTIAPLPSTTSKIVTHELCLLHTPQIVTASQHFWHC